MNRLTTMAAIVPLAALLSACDGSDGSSGADGANGLNSLLATRALPPGDTDCSGGGLAFDSGLDSSANGVLDESEITATEFLECEAAPLVRAFHASPDAPAVNIVVNGAAALTNVPFKAASGFLPAAASAQVLHAAAGAPPVDVFVTATGDVDIYLLADGTDFNDENVTPDFGAVAFTADTTQLSIAPGVYDVSVTPAGDKGVVAIEVQDLAVNAGQVLDVIARDPLANGSEGPFPQLIVIDYAAIGACPT